MISMINTLASASSLGLESISVISSKESSLEVSGLKSSGKVMISKWIIK